jgi:protein-tyrosine-phosphatase
LKRLICIAKAGWQKIIGSPLLEYLSCGCMKKILFVCVENAGRSQMAEAFAKLYGKDKIEALSAGTMPSGEVNPVVAQVMREKGIDISKNKPKLISNQMVREADMIIVMGCGAEGFCPAPLLDKVVNWELEDPKDKPIEKVREIRDEIERRVKKLIADLS